MGDGRTCCGRAAIRYDDKGHVIRSLRTTSKLDEITCSTCRWSPYLDRATVHDLWNL